MSLLLSLTLVANAKTIIPAPEGLAPKDTVLMVVVECSPANPAYADRMKYLENIKGLPGEVQNFLTAAPNYPGIDRVEYIGGLGAAETLAELKALTKDAPFERFFYVSAGPGIGADAGDPGYMCSDFDANDRSTALLHEDVKTTITGMSPIMIGFFDNSRNVTAAMNGELKIGTYGPTADDWGFENGFAMSAGNPGRYTEGSFLTALKNVLLSSKGDEITVESFILGMKTEALKISSKLAMYDKATEKPDHAGKFENGEAVLFTKSDKPAVAVTNAGLTPKPDLPTTKSTIELPKRGYHVTPARGTSFGLGGAALIGAGVTTKMALDLYAELEVPIDDDPAQKEAWRDGLDRLHTLRYVAGGLTVLGAAGIAGGFLLPDGKQNKPTAVLTVSPTSVSVAGTFY